LTIWKTSFEVQVNNGVKCLLSVVKEAPKARDPSIRHEDIQATKCLYGGVDQRRVVGHSSAIRAE
jgi:hypothetical protein